MEKLLATGVGKNGMEIRKYETYAEHDIAYKAGIITIKIPIFFIRFVKENKIMYTYRHNRHEIGVKPLNENTNSLYPIIKYLCSKDCKISLKPIDTNYFDLVSIYNLYKSI